MTIHFPDLSQYDSVNVQPGTPVVLARATLSASIADTEYIRFESEAASAGSVFVAYHWLNHGNLAAQADWAFQHVGPSVPLMMDCEDTPGNTGYNGHLTVPDVLGFADAYRGLGGLCHLGYCPHWYWGGFDLTPLTGAQVGLVSSDYSQPYSDNGVGWLPYGGVLPVQWQYTNSQPYGGGSVDFNAYQGSVQEYIRLVTTGVGYVSTTDDYMETFKQGSNVVVQGVNKGQAMAAMTALNQLLGITPPGTYPADWAGISDAKLTALLSKVDSLTTDVANLAAEVAKLTASHTGTVTGTLTVS